MGKFAPQLLNIAISIHLVNLLGIEGFGTYSLWLIIALFSVGTVCSAVDVHFQRSNDETLLVQYSLIKVLFCVGIFPFLYFTLEFYQLATEFILLVCFSFLIIQLVETKLVSYRILEKDYLIIPFRLLQPLVFFIQIYFFGSSKISTVVEFYFVSCAITFVFSLYKSSISTDVVRNSFSWYKIKSRSSGLMVIWLSILLTQVYGGVDMLLLNNHLGEEVLGTYRLSFMYASFIIPVVTIVNVIYLTDISKLINKKILLDVKNRFFIQIKIVSSLCFIYIFLIYTILPYWFEYFYPKVNKIAVENAFYLSFVFSLNALAMVSSYTLMAMKKEMSIFISSVPSGFFYVACIYLFISDYGVTAIIVSMFISYVIQNLFYIYFISKAYRAP